MDRSARESSKRDAMIDTIIGIISATRLPLHNEKILQEAIEELFVKNNVSFSREYRLDKFNIPDFFIDGIAVEIKIKGAKRSIYKQCERYAQFEDIKQVLLVTNVSMGFPPEINGKPCYVINLGKSWL